MLPPLSMTVRRTLYVPARVGVARVDPVAVAPSPKFHEYDTIVPSGSDDFVASNEQASPVHDCVNVAVGATSLELGLGMSTFFANSDVGRPGSSPSRLPPCRSRT